MVDEMRIADILREHGMHPDGIDLDKERERYIGQMREGLAKKGGSSLMMLPAYVSASGAVPRDQGAIVIDAGGTNLRVGRVNFGTDGEIAVECIERYPMPGTEGQVTRDEMFNMIARAVRPMLRGNDHIGFCFSFVFESLPNHDGIIEAMSKEVDVADVGGAYACAELEAALVRLGVPQGNRSYVILNDTVATLLGGKAAHTDMEYSSYVGLILGTGMNACYIERTDNIKKVAPGTYQAADTVVNMEAGIYTGLAQGAVDRAIDESSQVPGDHVFEKMISGGYFGKVLHGTFRLLCDGGLLSKEFSEKLLLQKEVSLKDITRYIEGNADESNPYFALAAGNPDDKQVMDKALEFMYERCAKIVVIMLSALAEQTDSGRDPQRPLCVCAEGTTFYKSPLLLKYVDILLKEYVQGKLGRTIRVVQTEDVTLVGTALAALIN